MFSINSYRNKIISMPNLSQFKETEIEYLNDIDFITGLDFFKNSISKFNMINICIPPYEFESDMFIDIDLISMFFKIPSKTIEFINNSCNDSDFIIIPIKLIFSENKFIYNINPNTFKKNEHKETAHSNLIIIDNSIGSIEYFEPHGLNIDDISYIINYINQIIELLKSKIPAISGYKFINSANTCKIGVQSLHNRKYNKGYCLVWTLFFIHLRLHNPKLTLEFLHDFITSSYSIDELNSLISKFITFIIELKNIDINTHYVLEYPINTDNYNIYNRITYLVDVYLQKLQYKSYDDCNLVVTELFSYKNNQHFNTIFRNSLLKHQLSINQNF